MKYYSMLAAIAAVVGGYPEDIPVTVERGHKRSENGRYTVQTIDCTLGYIDAEMVVDQTDGEDNILAFHYEYTVQTGADGTDLVI